MVKFEIPKQRNAELFVFGVVLATKMPLICRSALLESGELGELVEETTFLFKFRSAMVLGH